MNKVNIGIDIKTGEYKVANVSNSDELLLRKDFESIDEMVDIHTKIKNQNTR